MSMEPGGEVNMSPVVSVTLPMAWFERLGGLGRGRLWENVVVVTRGDDVGST